MTFTRDSRHRTDDDATTATSATGPGKSTRSAALPVQRKASPPVAATASPAYGVESSEDPFSLHLPIQRQADGGAVDGAGWPGASGGGSSLPADVQMKMESSFDADFSDVRVHEGAQASQMGALAYAQGTDLHFAPGQYNPGTSSGDALIGHELAHVQQQRAGRVSTPQGKGAPIVADHALEAEADRAGELAARGEAVTGLGTGSVASGAIQRKEADHTPSTSEQGPDTFGLGGYLAKLKAATGVSGDMGKYAEAKLGVTTPPIPQLGGGALKIEGEGRYLTSKAGNELEISLHVGVQWGIDLKLFKADVQVFGEGKVKLKAKDGEMLECLGAAVKGVLYDALRMMNVRNVASLANPFAARAAEWALGKEFFDLDVFRALQYVAASGKIPQWARDGAKQTLDEMAVFFGKHKGSYEVSIAIGVSADVGGGADGKGLSAGGSAKAVHGISSEAGDEVSDETRRNELAVEGHVKKGDTEAKVGYVFGGGRNVLSVDGAFAAENDFDFDKAKIVSVSGVMKLFAAFGFGTAVGKAATAPSGAELANAIVAGLATGASAIGNKDLKLLKKSYKLSIEVEREGEKPWADAKVDAKLFLGNSIGGEMDAGSVGKVEATAAAGTFISITREVKEHLPGGK